MMDHEPRQDGSFWDIGEPWRVLKRIENGHRSCDDLMSMIQERADMELRYAKSLRQWASKWDDAVVKGAVYGSVLAAWRTVLQEASAVAKIHEDCRSRLTGDQGPYHNVYSVRDWFLHTIMRVEAFIAALLWTRWTNEHYHQGGPDGLRETAEARQAFAAAQKDYAKLLAKVQRAKKAYHNASLAAYRARRFADDEASNPAVSPGVSWKLRERADGLALDRERLKQAYLQRVMVSNVTAKERYIQKMTSVFERWQEFERGRLEHVQSQLQLFVRNLNTHSNAGLGQLYQGIMNHVRSAKPAADVDEWGRQYGTGCRAHWPKFEEIDPRVHETASEPPLDYHQKMDGAGTTTDEITDEFTTDEFDSGEEHHFTQQQWGAGHHEPGRPYRSHQHQALDVHSLARPQYLWDQVGQRYHQQHPPEAHYSQNEDLSERWLDERRDGRDRRWDGGRGWDRRTAPPQQGNRDDVGFVRYPPRQPHHHRNNTMQPQHDNRHLPHHPHHHHDTVHPHDNTIHHHDDPLHHHDNTIHHHDTMHHHDNTQQRPQHHHDGHYEQQDSQHEGQRSKVDDHHRRESEFLHYNEKRDKSEYRAVDSHRSTDLDHGQSSSVYDTLGTSHSQESHLHGNHPLPSLLENGGGYHGHYDYHEKSQSDNILAVHQEVPSPGDVYPKQVTKDQSKATEIQGHGQVVSQVALPGVGQDMQTLSQLPAGATQPSASQKPTKTRPHAVTETQGHLRPSQTPPQTYIERRNGAEDGAQRMQKARQALGLKEGERLVRALYDFKPATRDEMALKQGEFLVQIGDHLRNGWAYGRKVGAMGHFPASYVQ